METKKCTCCGEIKPNTNEFFKRNYLYKDKIILQAQCRCCMNASRRKKRKSRAKPPETKFCITCGKKLENLTHNQRGRKYCSEHDVKTIFYRQKYDKVRVRVRSYKRVEPIQQVKTCIYCDVKFTTIWKNALYCSKRCRKRQYGKKTTRRIKKSIYKSKIEKF